MVPRSNQTYRPCTHVAPHRHADGEKRALRPPPQELPFELKVLEIALECVSGDLEQLAEELESAAHPALDNLTSKVCGGGNLGQHTIHIAGRVC